MTSLLTADNRRYYAAEGAVYRNDSGCHRRRVAFLVWNADALMWEVTPEQITSAVFEASTVHDVLHRLAEVNA